LPEGSAGATLSPKGDLGARRQQESVAVGGFRDGRTITAARYFKGGNRG